MDGNNCFDCIFAIWIGHGAGYLEEMTNGKSDMTNGKSDFVLITNELKTKVAEQLDLSMNEISTETELHVTNNE